MIRRVFTWIKWIVYVIFCLTIIALLTQTGFNLGDQYGKSLIESDEGWVSIGPPDTDIVEIKIFSLEPSINMEFNGAYVILLRTSSGQLLSSGVIGGYVEEWNWYDISNADVWKDIPLFALGRGTNDKIVLWIKQAGNEYQVDANGQWHKGLKDSVSPFEDPPKNYADKTWDYSQHPAWQTPPGKITQIQFASVGYWEEPIIQAFALLEGKEGVWYLRIFTNYALGMTHLFMILAGAICGFSVGGVLVASSVVFLMVYRKRKIT